MTTDPAPSDAAPSDPAPSDTAPSDPAPSDPAPSDPAPSDPAPSDDASGDGPHPTTFADLHLRSELVETLTALGYEEPTPIQRDAIPVMLSGRDVLGQAATGTGKTAAFALPILELLDDADERGDDPVALVLVPTRELAIQVGEALHRYGRRLGARVVPIYGGQPITRQLRILRDGVDVVVATPGRAIDHLRRGSLSLDSVATVVLDEADEMLDMGFAEDIEAVLAEAPDERQTVLLSATMPRRIQAIAASHQTDPVRIEIARETPAEGSSPRVRQVAYLVRRAHKATALGRILDVESPAAALVFCRTRAEVDTLTETLNARGYRAEALHGGMDQVQRDRVMGRLRSGIADLLVATDVAARGLDVDQLSHVVNYDVPSAPEAYVHRIGRVGRAGREGTAITLVEPREHRMLKTIERTTKTSVTVSQVPSVDVLRAHRLEHTRAALAVLLEGDDTDLDHVRVVVESLSDEHDLMEIALAAVAMAHRARAGEEDDADIPPVRVDRDDRPPRRERDGRRDKGPRSERGPRSDRGGRSDREQSGDRTRLFVNAGKDDRIRPGDLVGAIANETSLSGRDIGSIEVRDRFSLVEVPSDRVDEVIDALRSTTLRGRRVTARRERY